MLANPEEVKNRKGHKTDRKDAEHLADLLRHNHVRSSYIPAEPVRQLRDLTRRRVQLTQDATRERNRVQKGDGTSQCEDWQRAYGRVRSLGSTCCWHSWTGGLRQRKSLDSAHGSAKRKTPQLIAAIEGNRMSDHVRFLIRGCLRHLACLEEEVEELDAEILLAHATLYVSESLHTVTNHSRSRPTFSSYDLGRDRADLDPSRPLRRWRVGRACAQVIGKVQAFRKDHKPPTATLICVRLWCSVHGRQLVSATLSSGPAFND